MKERPIIFSGELVRAILDGRKSQTRRTRGLEAVNDNPGIWAFLEQIENEYHFGHGDPNGDAWGEGFVKCPYGVVGDKLWVKETFRYAKFGLGCGGYTFGIEYKTGHIKFAKKARQYAIQRKNKDKYRQHAKWRSSRFMPKWVARIWLEITNIRVERQLDITLEDAIKEGFGDVREFNETFLRLNPKLKTANPWLWVIEFKVKD